MWEWVKILLFCKVNPLPHNPDFLTTLGKMPIENIVRKGENASKQHFLLFLPCFLLCQKGKLSYYQHSISLSANAFDLVQSKMFGRVTHTVLHFNNPVGEGF